MGGRITAENIGFLGGESRDGFAFRSMIVQLDQFGGDRAKWRGGINRDPVAEEGKGACDQRPVGQTGMQ